MNSWNVIARLFSVEASQTMIGKIASCWQILSGWTFL